MRMLSFALACFFSMLLIGCSTTTSVSTTNDFEVNLSLADDEIAFTYFDLMDGEATLIQSGSGGTVLIGTGDETSQVELAQLLHSFHVTELDALILVNDDNEYSGNTEWITTHYPVKKVVVPATLKEDVKMKYHVKEEMVETWDVGMEKELLNGLQVEVLYAGEDKKDSSFVLLFTYGNQKTLYMGLADEKVEQELAEMYSLKSAILKVADFGSALGTSQGFLNEVDPQVAILFSRNGKRPSEYVLERLQETWIDVYQTSISGTIMIKCTRDNYEILTVHTNKQEMRVASKNS